MNRYSKELTYTAKKYPNAVKTEQDKKHWNEAEKAAEKSGPKKGTPDYYAYVMSIFEKMKGGKKEGSVNRFSKKAWENGSPNSNLIQLFPAEPEGTIQPEGFAEDEITFKIGLGDYEVEVEIEPRKREQEEVEYGLE